MTNLYKESIIKVPDLDSCGDYSATTAFLFQIIKQLPDEAQGKTVKFELEFNYTKKENEITYCNVIVEDKES